MVGSEQVLLTLADKAGGVGRVRRNNIFKEHCSIPSTTPDSYRNRC